MGHVELESEVTAPDGQSKRAVWKTPYDVFSEDDLSVHLSESQCTCPEIASTEELVDLSFHRH